MAGHGGARKGAGRKPKAEKYKRPIARAEKKIADRLPEIVDKMIELADGIMVQVENRDGSTDVYARPPDREACIYLLNRIMGRPTEHVESNVDVTSAGESVVTHIYLPDNGRGDGGERPSDPPPSGPPDGVPGDAG